MPTDLQRAADIELYQMLAEARERAHPAFEELYARHGSRVYTYCRRMLGDDALVEDMFQETFVRFYNSAAEGRTMTNIPAYLLRIARNLCLNHKQRRSNSTVPFDEFRFPVVQESYETSELLKLIEMAMESLSDDYRDALVLKEHLGLTYNEIAEISGTTMPVIRVRIYRAKNKIREILAPYLEDLQH